MCENKRKIPVKTSSGFHKGTIDTYRTIRNFIVSTSKVSVYRNMELGIGNIFQFSSESCGFAS